MCFDVYPFCVSKITNKNEEILYYAGGHADEAKMIFCEYWALTVDHMKWSSLLRAWSLYHMKKMEFVSCEMEFVSSQFSSV